MLCGYSHTYEHCPEIQSFHVCEESPSLDVIYLTVCTRIDISATELLDLQRNVVGRAYVLYRRT